MSITLNSQFYVVGGTVNPDSPSYVVRQADQELFDRVMAGDFCYVLTSRQMGKSSLMARTAKRLSETGLHTAIVDLTQIGTEKEKQSADQWYYGIAHRILRELKIRSVDLSKWWQSRRNLPALQRLMEFFSDLVLEKIGGNVIVFIDEIDSTISLPFTDDFFAAIRACYNARATELDYRRLTFVLLGVASPADLMKNSTRTPFNIGRRIELTDFTLEEAKLLVRELNAQSNAGERILERILHWTGGHPYLTQKLCEMAQSQYKQVDDHSPSLTGDEIDTLADSGFLSLKASREDHNLVFVREWLTVGDKLNEEALELYTQIRQGQLVENDPLSLAQTRLKLSGIVIVQERSNLLCVRNRIYECVFTHEWAKKILYDISHFYVTGGTVRRDAACYVSRRADQELYDRLLARDYCSVLTSRQMGKSSLMVRTATRLRDKGAVVAVLDLTAVGSNLNPSEWYSGLLLQLGRRLDLEDELLDFWVSHQDLPPVRCWMNAIRDVVLQSFERDIVIFIDEFDVLCWLPFSVSEFFTCIREFYFLRAEDLELRRLSFAFLGVATPSDLVDESGNLLSSITHLVELTDFTFDEVKPLAKGLGTNSDEGDQALKRILYWTGGHPYLTQRFCAAVADSEHAKTDSNIDQMCEAIFLSRRAIERDDNLIFVRERLLRSDVDLGDLLRLYINVCAEKRVLADERNPLIRTLILSGVVKVEGVSLRVRNRIYERAFSIEWAKMMTPHRSFFQRLRDAIGHR